MKVSISDTRSGKLYNSYSIGDIIEDKQFTYKLIQIKNEQYDLDLIGWQLRYRDEYGKAIPLDKTISFKCEHTVKSLPVISMHNTFTKLNHSRVDVSGMDTRNVVDMREMFSDTLFLRELNLTTFDTSNVRNLMAAFAGMLALQHLDVKGWDTSKCRTFREMFDSDLKLKELDIGHFDTSKAEDIESIFLRCASLERADIESWELPNVKHISHIFNGCRQIKNITMPYIYRYNQEEISSMFAGCKNVSYIDLRGLELDVNSNTICINNFRNCNNLKFVLAKTDKFIRDADVIDLPIIRISHCDGIKSTLQKLKLLNGRGYIYITDDKENSNGENTKEASF